MSVDRELDRLALEALLGDPGERARARARLAAAPDGEARIAALARTLGAAGEELRAGAAGTAGGPARQARFVSAVLARTTRQDLSWRGDLALFLDFLRGRLRASPALRFVAVLLALQLVAAPAVALLVVLRRETPQPLVIRIEPPREEPFDALPEEPPALEDELAAAARRAESRENALARERWVLGALGPRAPIVTPAPGAPAEERLLAARAALLSTRAGAVTAPVEPDELTPLALALWTELALDRRVLLGVDDDALGRSALRLAEHARAADLAPGTAAVVAAAVRRSAELGVVEAAEVPGTAPGLLEPAWFDALGLAAAEHDLAQAPALEAWLAWGGR